jgi:hypothetical protein
VRCVGLQLPSKLCSLFPTRYLTLTGILSLPICGVPLPQAADCLGPEDVGEGAEFFVFSPFCDKNLRLDPQKFYLQV